MIDSSDKEHGEAQEIPVSDNNKMTILFKRLNMICTASK